MSWDVSEFKAALEGNTIINVWGHGMPTLVQEVISDPGQFGFDVAIHLRLLAIWGHGGGINLRPCVPIDDRTLQRSIAVQLGIIEQGDTRALMDAADEEDEFRESRYRVSRSALPEVATRIYRLLAAKRYLLVVENVPDGGWNKWDSMGVPTPSVHNGCRLVLSSYQRLHFSRDSVAPTFGTYFFCSYEEYKPRGNLRKVAETVAASLNRELPISITADDVERSVLYWWAFKPLEQVPVEELFYSWMYGEVCSLLLPPSPPSSLPPSSSTSGRMELYMEVGQLLMEELCRQYLLKVVRRNDSTTTTYGWFRKALNYKDMRHPLGRRESLQSPFFWMGVSLEERESAIIRGDGTLFKLPSASVASSFMIDLDSSRELQRLWTLTGDDDDYMSLIQHDIFGQSSDEDADLLLKSLTTLFTVRNKDSEIHVDEPRYHEDLDLFPTSRYNLFPSHTRKAQIHQRRFLRITYNSGRRRRDDSIDVVNVDDLLTRVPRLKVLDLSYTNILSLPDSLFFSLSELRVLLLRHCRCLETLAGPTATAATASSLRPAESALQKLKVLDVSNSSIRDISDEVLLHHMTSLEELLLCEVSYLTRLPILRMLGNLGVFRVTHTSLKGHLPDELFERTTRLRVLDLSHNHSITSLPASLRMSSSTLEEIYLHGCAALEQVDREATALLQDMPNLHVFALSSSPIRQLSLKGCRRLEMVELSMLDGLETLDLSGTAIKEVPMRIQKSQRLRRQDLLGMHCLRRIPWACWWIPEQFNLDQCICGPSSDARGPAHEEHYCTQGTQPVSRIFVSDPRILRPFVSLAAAAAADADADDNDAAAAATADAAAVKDVKEVSLDDDVIAAAIAAAAKDVKEVSLDDAIAKFISINVAPTLAATTADIDPGDRSVIKPFYLCISPCDFRASSRDEARHQHAVAFRRRVPAPYQAILPTAETLVISPNHGTDDVESVMHVEVKGGGGGGGGGRSLKPAEAFFNIAESVSLYDHHYGDDLSSISGQHPCLKKCRLERCHNMKCVFDSPWQPEFLESLWISELSRLTVVWKNIDVGQTSSYDHLRYVHLEHCRRVISVFPVEIHLPRLEKLVIRSCPCLKHVFAPPPEHYPDPAGRGRQITLSGLTAMVLLDLPSLERICHTSILSPREPWKLKVRGCWKLRRLPTLTAHPADAAGRASMEVNGEPEWKKNLVI